MRKREIDRAVGVDGSPTLTPSISTSTWLELEPRTNTEVCVPGPPDCWTDTPGTVAHVGRGAELPVLHLLVGDHRDGAGGLASLGRHAVGRHDQRWQQSTSGSVCARAASGTSDERNTTDKI